MASKSLGRQITSRDLETLAALDYVPLTAKQLAKLSETWPTPFGSAELVRKRLLLLAEAKLVTSHPYAILQPGQPEHYYLLTSQGYQLLHGPGAKPPTKRYFTPVALATQTHQRALSEFVVQTLRGTARSGIKLAAYRRENTLRLDGAGGSVYPDAAFVLKRGDDMFRFYVEIDNSSERILSAEPDSIERKLRVYDTFQDLAPDDRFRVLFISARDSQDRLRHILDVADRVMRNADRTLFYGITLRSYLATGFPVTSPIFMDRRGNRHGLIPDTFHRTNLNNPPPLPQHLLVAT